MIPILAFKKEKRNDKKIVLEEMHSMNKVKASLKLITHYLNMLAKSDFRSERGTSCLASHLAWTYPFRSPSPQTLNEAAETSFTRRSTF